jgi:signal peptidase I
MRRSLLALPLIASMLPLSACGLIDRNHFTYAVRSRAMEPAIAGGDVVVANPQAYTLLAPRDGDIAIFWAPVFSKSPYMKRVMGVPGDRIRIHAGIVYRNGRKIAEPYLGTAAAPADYELEIGNYGISVDGERLDPAEANIPPRELWTAPDRVPPHCYFMLGDNRNDSEDSHVFGFAQDTSPFIAGVVRSGRAGFVARVEAIVSPVEHAHVL